MTPILSDFKTAGRAAFLAALLGMGAMAATPVFAQGEPPTGLSLNVPDGGGDATTQRRSGEAQGQFNPGDDEDFYCLSNGEIRDGLEDYGFDRVRIRRNLGRDRVEVTAYWGRNQYSMRVDRCTGEVDRIRRIRRGGFGLQFNFGG